MLSLPDLLIFCIHIFRLDYATLVTKDIPSIVYLRLLHSIKIYKSKHKQKEQSR